MYCTPIPNLQCVYATQPFPRDAARKNSAEIHEPRHTPRSGPKVKDREAKAKNSSLDKFKSRIFEEEISSSRLRECLHALQKEFSIRLILHRQRRLKETVNLVSKVGKWSKTG